MKRPRKMDTSGAFVFLILALPYGAHRAIRKLTLGAAIEDVADEGLAPHHAGHDDHDGGDGNESPRGGTGSWAGTAVREILRRPLYAGRIVWNKSQKGDVPGNEGATQALRERVA